MNLEWEVEEIVLPLTEIERYLKVAGVKKNINSKILQISALRCHKMCKAIITHTCAYFFPFVTKVKGTLLYTIGRNVD